MENTVVIDVTASKANQFTLPPCPQFERQEFQPVETFVVNAIAAKDSSKEYRVMLDSIRKPKDPPTLCKVLLALRGNTLHQLTGNPKSHAQLLHWLFRLDPFLKEKHDKLPDLYSLADAHFHLLLALVSANTVFLQSGMTALWRLLTTNAQEAPAERTSRIHAALATMLRLVPKGNSELFPIIASSFPFRTRPKPELEWYSRQCLTALQYVPTLHAQMLEMLLDKCLEMDVEIKIGNGGQVSIDESNHSLDNAEEEMFELELDNDTTRKPMEQDKVEEKVDEMADKLDSLMTIVLEHIQAHSAKHGAHSIYRMVSPVFDSSILTTHRSKFVQFVILFICGLEHNQLAENKPPHAPVAQLDREFAAKLIDIVLDPYRATVTRQSGACYLASFISRAKFVSPETSCETIAALLKWAEAYMQSDYSTRASDLREQCDLHSLFYTVCQAAFYIMCFRGAESIRYYRSAIKSHERQQQLPNEDDGCSYADPEHVDISPQRWASVCGHPLQPLRFCLESVRGEFLHVAHVFRLLPPDLLKRLNVDDSKMSSRTKRRKPVAITTAATLAKRRMKGGVGGIGQGSNPLDSFFPYDPYLLSHSHQFVEPFYKNWEGSVEDDDEMTDYDDGDQVADDSSVEDDTSALGDSDEADDDDQNDAAAHMPQSVDSYLKPMSYISNATIESTSTKSSFQPGTPDEVARKKQEQRQAWSETLKRTRAASIESNGSW
jgi:RNA polymerase I-specific transcription initiation factor RRN3